MKSRRDSNKFISKSAARQLLSSICLALNNVDVCIPVFVVVDEPSMGKRLGTCRPSTHQGVSSTEFVCDMVTKIPRKYDHVDGLMELFKSKIRVRRSSVLKFKPTVDVRYTWMIDSRRSRWRDDPLIPDLRWRRGPVQRNGDSSRWSYIDNGVRLLEGADFDGVPICGDVNDPLRSIHVSARFQTFRENQFADNSVYSDLRKLISQDLKGNETLNVSWTVRANWNQTVSTPLTDCVRGIVRLTSSSSSMIQEEEKEEEPFLNVQSVLTELFTKIRSRDARHDETERFPAPAGSFLSLMAMRIMDAWSFAEASGSSLKPCVILELWTGITKRIRERWQSRRLIPRVYARRPGRHTKRRSVHNNYCLLHQKLESINICIETETPSLNLWVLGKQIHIIVERRNMYLQNIGSYYM